MLLNTAYPKMDFRGVVKIMTIPLKFSLGIIAIKTSKNSCCEILVPLILDIPFTSTCLISVTLSLSGYFNKIGCLINFIETNSFFFSQTLAALHRQLRLLTPLYNVRDPYKKEKAHPRVVFLFNDMLVVSTSNADPSPVVFSQRTTWGKVRSVGLGSKG